MPDVFTSMDEFHIKFGFTQPEKPQLLDPDLMSFRVKFLREEFEETCDAYDAGDLAKVADGLIDLIYVAAGTLWLMGVPSQPIWDAVHGANMQKVRADRPEQSTRGSTFDVIKPPGWQAPDVGGIIEAYTKEA